MRYQPGDVHPGCNAQNRQHRVNPDFAAQQIEQGTRKEKRVHTCRSVEVARVKPECLAHKVVPQILVTQVVAQAYEVCQRNKDFQILANQGQVKERK